MKVNKSCALLGAVLLVSACAIPSSDREATSSESIIGGTNDSGDPSVVLVNADNGNEGWWCTGTVIAKRLVLTAAHCVEDATSQTKFTILFGGNPIEGQPSAIANVASFAHDPQYLATNNIAAGHDAAVLVLATDSPEAPLAINTTPLTQSMVGSPVYVVGYGNNDGQNGTGAGVKRSIHTKIAGLEQGVVDVGAPGQTTCQGDSGGPTFMDINGKTVIIGITSYGEEGCVSAGSSTRVDLSASWIQPFIDANGGNAGAGGTKDGGTDSGGTFDSGTDSGGTTKDAGGGGTVDASKPPPKNPACVYQCSDYGYAPGQCYMGWYCIPDGEDEGCLGQTTCD